MYCGKCGTDMGQFRYCPNCGFDSQSGNTQTDENSENVAKTQNFNNDGTQTQQVQNNTQAKSKSISESFTEKIKEAFTEITGGNSNDIKFSLTDLCCDVFKKHKAEESEALLITGTSSTTPDVKDIANGWNRPWLYSRILAVLAITFGLLYICVSNFKNVIALPGLIFIGAMMMPFSLLILFWETNIPRNISIFDLVKMFFVGGVSSLVFTLTIFSFIEVGELDVIGATLVGIIEEVGKLVAVVLFIHMNKSKYILNGLLIGAAIGAGFAVFESAGYAFVYGETLNGILDSIVKRGLLAAGGHIVWAAMSGAAIMLAKKDAPMSWDVFKKGNFWRLFVIPIILHALWDMPFAAGSGNYTVLVALVVLAWIFILALIRSGMAEVSRISIALNEQQNAEEEQQEEI